MTDALTSYDLGRLAVPGLIFLGGMTYIAIDTVRIILMNRGFREVAPLLGFVEVVIFLLAVGKVLSGPLSLLNVFAYAAGWAVGTFIGMWMEGRLALGLVVARGQSRDTTPGASSRRSVTDSTGSRAWPPGALGSGSGSSSR